MRVLVTRPQADAERTAALLKSMGHEPLIAPVSHIVPVDGDVPAGQCDAILLTSQNGVRHGVARLPREALALPVFAVGERTAERARAAGFAHVHAGPGAGADLARVIRTLLPGGAHLLYLAGEPRKPALERELAAAGFRPDVAVVYRAAPVAELVRPVIEMIGSGAVGAVLHYSREGAKRFIALARGAGVLAEAQRLRHLCLSGDVASALDGACEISVAEAPNESALLKLLDDCRSGNYI